MDEKAFEKEIERDVKEKVTSCCEKWGKDSSCGGFGYFAGFIGAAVYFISTSNGFWPGALGFLKAIVWPAFLVFKALQFLGA